FVFRPAVRDERGEDPADELVGHDLIRARKTRLLEVLRELPVEELLLVVERLRILDRALHELALELRVRLEVEDQRVLCEDLFGLRIVELDDAAARVVDEMIVAVDLASLLNELLDVAHRADLGLTVQPLALLELLDGQTAQVGSADLAEERR